MKSRRVYEGLKNRTEGKNHSNLKQSKESFEFAARSSSVQDSMPCAPNSAGSTHLAP